MEQKAAKQDRTEVAYAVNLTEGKEYIITKEDYDELKRTLIKGEIFGAFIANEGMNTEIVVLIKHVISVNKYERYI